MSKVTSKFLSVNVVLAILFMAVMTLAPSAQVAAEEVFRIEVGRDYNSYSQRDLQRRVWELERAVAQLQSRVFELELSRAARPLPTATPAVDTWICKVTAMGVTYTGTGGSKAVAEHKAIETCKEKADDFFCKEAKCSQ
ncbi:MAG: hypothetical protein J0L82_15795 [Deltaproteobacteria bacterium]|nr:hypothetical protein [Deltaproteobacteria bacterium]